MVVEIPEPKLYPGGQPFVKYGADGGSFACEYPPAQSRRSILPLPAPPHALFVFFRIAGAHSC